MQDYNYWHYGIFETTLEVSCCKFPNASDLQYLWEVNKDALINYLLEVQKSKTKSSYHKQESQALQSISHCIINLWIKLFT